MENINIPLIEKTRDAILTDQEKYRRAVIDELLKLQKVKEWIIDSALTEFPPSHKGTWACTLVDMFKLPIPKNSRNYSLKHANILLLEDSEVKDYLLTGDLTY